MMQYPNLEAFWKLYMKKLDEVVHSSIVDRICLPFKPYNLFNKKN